MFTIKSQPIMPTLCTKFAYYTRIMLNAVAQLLWSKYYYPSIISVDLLNVHNFPLLPTFSNPWYFMVITHIHIVMKPCYFEMISDNQYWCRLHFLAANM